MKDNIVLEKLNQSFRLKTESGKSLGSFQMDPDGSYYFWEDEELTGCWTSQNLREIADKLDEVNKPYNDLLKEYFAKKQKE